MSVYILMAVYKRLALTDLVYQGLQRLISYGAKIGLVLKPVIVYSEEEHKSLAQKYGFDMVYAENYPVSEKHNVGLSYIMNQVHLDYVLQIGSDDFLSNEGLELLAEEMRKGTDFFGFNKMIAAHAITHEMKVFHYNDGGFLVLGLGRCFSKRLLEIVIKQQGSLWPRDINSGLDKHSQKLIIDSTMLFPKIIQTEVPVIMDVKGFESISDWCSWEGEPTPWMSSFSPEVDGVRLLSITQA